ncbi:Hypothetical predicted protein [Podarcis lilfordi]|uniref:Uncharacterized protein n=1 Tax=Podarcis lilfordi TaxID=74358 RepID=A0AA35PN62_9SAUR|nr:Hypothetical predicted protein [Podarcis lilfordi]
MAEGAQGEEVRSLPSTIAATVAASICTACHSPQSPHWPHGHCSSFAASLQKSYSISLSSTTFSSLPYLHNFRAASLGLRPTPGPVVTSLCSCCFFLSATSCPQNQEGGRTC